MDQALQIAYRLEFIQSMSSTQITEIDPTVADVMLSNPEVHDEYH